MYSVIDRGKQHIYRLLYMYVTHRSKVDRVLKGKGCIYSIDKEWEESKKSMVRVGGIHAFGPAQAPVLVYVLNGGQLGAGDPLGRFQHPLECFTA